MKCRQLAAQATSDLSRSKVQGCTRRISIDCMVDEGSVQGRLLLRARLDLAEIHFAVLNYCTAPHVGEA
jgi:hypothetical protein